MRIVPNNQMPCPICKIYEGNPKHDKSKCEFCNGWGTVDKDEIMAITEESLSLWQRIKEIIAQEVKE